MNVDQVPDFLQFTNQNLFHHFKQWVPKESKRDS